MNAEQVLWSLMFFGILLTAFGISTGGPNATIVVNNLLAPLPQVQSLYTGIQNCSLLDASCAANNVARATENLALAILYPFILLYIGASRLFAFGSFLSGLFSGPIFSAQGVPFLGFVMAGLVLIVGFEIIRIVRGNASAGTL